MGNGLVERIGDYQLPWFQLRGRGDTLVAIDDTALDLAAGKGGWGDKPAEPSEQGWDSLNCVPAVAVNVAKMSAGKIKTVQIIGYGTNAADEQCNWILYAYRSRYSPAIRVAAGVAILGTMDCVKDPVTNASITTGFYADTWGITDDYWGEVTVKDNAANACSVMTFDMRGYLFLYMEIDIPSASQVTAFGAAFSGV